jgi:hypothetical protein
LDSKMKHQPDFTISKKNPIKPLESKTEWANPG